MPHRNKGEPQAQEQPAVERRKLSDREADFKQIIILLQHMQQQFGVYYRKLDGFERCLKELEQRIDKIEKAGRKPPG